MTRSKSFRAILPSLTEEELQRLGAWSEEYCAAASVFRDDDCQCVIWLASKERLRTREAFMRFCRKTLQRLAVRTKPRGRWLILADEESVRSEAASYAPVPAVQHDRPSGAVVVEEAGCDKIVQLTGSGQVSPLAHAALANSVCKTAEGGDSGDRIVFLGAEVGKRRSAGELQVFKDG